MQLRSLHFLLTYKCTIECEHCFVFGSPKNKGSISEHDLIDWIDQAANLHTVKWIFFEGGEPFLYPDLLAKGLKKVKDKGLSAGIVTNGFWAKKLEAGVKTLRPIASLIDYMQISCDDLHGNSSENNAHNARKAAAELGIERGMIKIKRPCSGMPPDSCDVLFKGRAALRLAGQMNTKPWNSFGKCGQENFRDPGRVHIDQYGYAHLCQGIVLGDLNKASLEKLVKEYEPERHPIISLINKGGPALLVTELGCSHVDNYVDQCHLCYMARKELSARFPEQLAPGQLYSSA